MKALISRAVLRNFGALLTLQAGTYLIPLFLVPYLIRVLGLELFGTWMFAMAFVIMARTCVNYGFDLTATREVAASAKDSRALLSQLVVDVTSARVIMWILSFAALLAISLVIEPVADVRLLFAIAFFIVLGEALFPVWLFQGMETMGVITLLRLGSKLANLALVLFLVKGPDDLLLVPFLEALTSVASGLISAALALNRFGLHLCWPRLSRIRHQFRDGAPIFIATLATQFYTTVNMIILGLMIGPAAVGAYSLADKIYSALRGLLGPFVQAIFPAMARLHEKSRSEFTQIYRNLLMYLLPLLCLVGMALFFAADTLVKLATGSHEVAAVMALQVFAISFPFALGSFLAPMLVVRGRGAVLMRVNLIGGALGLVLSPMLVGGYGTVGSACVFLAVQVYNSVALIIANRSARSFGAHAAL